MIIMRLSPQIDQIRPPAGESPGQAAALFGNSTLGVAITNSGFRFLSANQAFLNMLGCSSERLQQLSFFDICIDEDRDGSRTPLRELREGARLHYEVETSYRRADGTALPVDAYFSAMGGPAPTFLLVTVDIAARRAAEDALRAAQSELNRVARLTTVGAMAASIAHEISQPLTSIVMNSNAGLRWLDRPEPDLDENSIGARTHRQ